MPDIIIYSKTICPHCVRAKALLQRKGAEYTEILLDQNPEEMERMMERTGRRTVPQIYIGEHHVGGADDLFAAESTGELDKLLAN